MRTAVVSDLHLGRFGGGDLLRDRWAQEVLLAEIEGADRVVLLGDVLELSELRLPVVLERSRDFFEALGRAMAGRPVVLVPGNHDHRLAEPLLERVAIEGRPLGLEERSGPVGEPAELLAAWLGTAGLEIAYPGLWLREDTYATHGHYMDCHRSLPRLECIAAASIRVLGPLPGRPFPHDYERRLGPVYGSPTPSPRPASRPGSPNPSSGRGRRSRSWPRRRAESRRRAASGRRAGGPDGGSA
jgi:hypothetical protein